MQTLWRAGEDHRQIVGGELPQSKIWRTIRGHQRFTMSRCPGNLGHPEDKIAENAENSEGKGG